MVLFDAATLALVDTYPLDRVVPFHAHGIVCQSGHCPGASKAWPLPLLP